MSGEVRVKEGDVNVSEMIQEMDSGAVVTYTVEYAQYVEFPTTYTGPKPPFQPLRDWVGRKWADLSDDLKTDENGNSLTKDATAWKLQTIIYEHGTRGVHFGQRGLNTAKQAAPAIARQYEGSGDPNAPEKIVAEVVEVGFNRSQAIIAQEASDTGDLLQSGSIAIVDDPSQIASGGAGGGD